jgi:hypothetical protein
MSSPVADGLVAMLAAFLERGKRRACGQNFSLGPIDIASGAFILFDP